MCVCACVCVCVCASPWESEVVCHDAARLVACDLSIYLHYSAYPFDLIYNSPHVNVYISTLYSL